MPNPGSPARSFTSPRLLCVDDDERFLKVFTFFLKEVGFEVSSTSDPDKALELATSFPAPDLAILDLQMPRCNGVGLAPTLKALRPDLPILIFSGSPDVAMIKSPAVDATYSKGEHVAGLIAKIHELALPRHRGLFVAEGRHHDSL
jgi:CheY-like chemotaxis protein